MAIESAPPMAHAVGGSLGSALALLLLYPLERARVEMQTMQATSDDDSESLAAEATTEELSDGLREDKVTTRLLPPHASRGGGLVAAAVEEEPVQDKLKDNTPASVSDESWGAIPSSSSSSSDHEIAGPTTTFSGPALQKKMTRRQKNLGILKCIYQLHHRKQLYRGVTPVVTTMAASNFVFFYMHSFLKQWLLKLPHNKSRQQASLRLSLLASTLAGVCNVLLTNPMWVANLRIVTSSKSGEEKNENLWREMKSIVESEGWTHLWNGTPASLLLVSNPVIQFVAYEQLKNQLLQALRQSTTSSLKPLEAFVLGAIAKAISTVLTYPLQLAQTVLRVQKQEEQQSVPEDSPTTPTPQQPSSSPKYNGTMDCMIKIYQHRGLEGWFAGMRTKLLQTVLTAAFTFLTYEQIVRAIMAVHRALQEGRRVRPHGHVAAGVPVP